MNILAIDTSSALLGIALQSGDDYYESNLNIGLHHTENLMVEIETILAKAKISAIDLELIVVSKGPGSFTGLRIGMSAAKGLAFGVGAPLVSVPSLDVWALGKGFFHGAVLPVLDARKQRVYTAFYEGGKRKGDYLDIAPARLFKQCASYGNILLTGPFAPALFELRTSGGDLSGTSFVLDPQYGSPHTWELLHLGVEQLEKKGADTETEGPLYIRPSEAELSLMGKTD